MPWHLPEDLQHFKQITSGHPVIMGRRTWESFRARVGLSGTPMMSNPAELASVLP